MISSWSLLPTTRQSSTPIFRDEWRELLQSSDDPFGLYQSPEWFDLMRNAQDGSGHPHAVAVRRDKQGRLIGVVPLFGTEEPIRFPLVFGLLHTTSRRKMIKLLSGCLLLPPGEDWIDGLFKSLAKRNPHRPVLKIESIPRPGPLYDYLQSSARIRAGYFLQEVPGPSRIHTIPLPTTYEKFLASYSAKKRYNLRRQLRLLQTRTAGKLAMYRYESSEEIPELVTNYATLLQACGKIAVPYEFDRKFPSFEDQHGQLARVGLLRSYVLKDAEHPVACVLGYHFGKTFCLGQTRHDPAYEAVSPGTALLHMVIEDLIKDGRIELVNLGYGAPKSDYQSTNVARDYVSYWLIPRTPKSRVFQTCYQTFRRSVALLKLGASTLHPARPAQPPERSVSDFRKRTGADPKIKIDSDPQLPVHHTR